MIAQLLAPPRARCCRRVRGRSSQHVDLGLEEGANGSGRSTAMRSSTPTVALSMPSSSRLSLTTFAATPTRHNPGRRAGPVRWLAGEDADDAPLAAPPRKFSCGGIVDRQHDHQPEKHDAPHREQRQDGRDFRRGFRARSHGGQIQQRCIAAHQRESPAPSQGFEASWMRQSTVAVARGIVRTTSCGRSGTRSKAPMVNFQRQQLRQFERWQPSPGRGSARREW